MTENDGLRSNTTENSSYPSNAIENYESRSSETIMRFDDADNNVDKDVAMFLSLD